jgi:hypothetical protein
VLFFPFLFLFFSTQHTPTTPCKLPICILPSLDSLSPRLSMSPSSASRRRPTPFLRPLLNNQQVRRYFFFFIFFIPFFFLPFSFFLPLRVFTMSAFFFFFLLPLYQKKRVFSALS